MDTANRDQHAIDALEVHTTRLRLVALNADLARLQIEDRRAFFAALGAQHEAAWPPELNDDTSMATTLEKLETRPGETGWHAWVFLLGWTPGGLDRAVGAGGFHGPPDADGVIEIGYSMLASFREQGLATEAVEGLLGWAFGDKRVRCVRAHTLAHLNASRRVLEKAGFRETAMAAGAAAGTQDGETIVRYERERP